MSEINPFFNRRYALNYTSTITWGRSYAMLNHIYFGKWKLPKQQEFGWWWEEYFWVTKQNLRNHRWKIL